MNVFQKVLVATLISVGTALGCGVVNAQTTPQNPANLVKNGYFELGSSTKCGQIINWNCVGNPNERILVLFGAGPSPALFFGTFGNGRDKEITEGEISQELDLVRGQRYQVNFQMGYRNNGGSLNDGTTNVNPTGVGMLNVKVGNQLIKQFVYNRREAPSFGIQNNYSYTFTARRSGKISFGLATRGAAFTLDNIEVLPVN